MKTLSFRLFLLYISVFCVVLLRLNLAVTRYIDPDEFAHLHWSYLVSQGITPYTSFFINFTPIYYWAIAPLVTLIQSSMILIVARCMQYILIVSIALFVSVITYHISKQRQTALLSIFFFLIFPMTFDKTIEIRPDTLMTLLYFVAFYLVLRSNPISRPTSIVSGILSGTSVVMMQKIIYGIPALMLCIFLQSHKRILFQRLIEFIVSCSIPLLLFAGYILLTNTTYAAYENIVHGSVLIKLGEGSFSPLKAWSHYPLVYVNEDRVSLPWIANVILWMSSLTGIALLLKKNLVLSSVITCFLGLGIMSLFLFPTPYLQYFIPLSVAVSSMSAISFIFVISHLKHLYGTALLAIVLVFFGFSFWLQYEIRTSLGSSMSEQLHVIDNILQLSHPDESVYDMVGSYIFRPDAYYICCNVYSAFADKLSMPIPKLSQSLKQHQTKFVILDRGGKSLWLPKSDDLQYLKTYYFPSSYPKIYTVGMRYACHDSRCVQVDSENIPRNTESQTIVAPITETYRITTVPANQPLTIDGRETQYSIKLSQGEHTLIVSNSTTMVQFQLDRDEHK